MSVAREKRIQEAMAWALKRMADLEAENAKLRERIERVNLEMQVEIATLDDKIAENARLNEKIEQLELLEARSAREAAMERQRVEVLARPFREAGEADRMPGATDSVPIVCPRLGAPDA